ncbi:MAG: hypothetical protein ACLQVI_30400 [Polyangiaceae bacterium]
MSLSNHSSKPSEKSSSQSKSNHAALAAQVIAQMDAIESLLNLDIVVPPNDRYQIRALRRVTDTAIGLASDIVSAEPDRFPDFTDLPTAASYVKTLAQVAERASTLTAHLQNSIQNQRTPAASKTLALYAVVKGLGRITANETMREKIPQLKAEIAPKLKDPKPKQTKTEKAVKTMTKQNENRVARAMKLLAKAGVAVTTTPTATPTPTGAATPAPPPH